MEAVFLANAVVVRQSIVLSMVFVAVDPSWKTTDLVVFRLLHLPK